MLQFQKEYNIAHQSFEDFVLVIFVLVDDLYKKVAPRDNHNRPFLSAVIDQIFIEVAKQFEDEVFIANSFPLEVCKIGRAHFCKTFRDSGATYAKNPYKKQTYFGYKVHVLTTGDGAIKAFEITGANVDDRCALFDLSPVVKARSIILGDKGYISEPLENALKEQGQILLPNSPTH